MSTTMTVEQAAAIDRKRQEREAAEARAAEMLARQERERQVEAHRRNLERQRQRRVEEPRKAVAALEICERALAGLPPSQDADLIQARHAVSEALTRTRRALAYWEAENARDQR